MATALHIYANLLWRDNRTKKSAAIRLLQEPHYRLHLDELSKSLLSNSGSSIPSDLLAPGQLAQLVSGDYCFVYSEGTGNVLLDAASLLAAGKNCLKAQIDRVWDTSTPLSWARNQLAWYIVCRQHIDMRPPDLFLAPVDDAESFLAAAWTSRMDFRDHPDHPYASLHQLLGNETRLELTPDQKFIRLNFNKLLQPQQQEAHQAPPGPQQMPPPPQQLLQSHHEPPPPPPQQQQQQQQDRHVATQGRAGTGQPEWGEDADSSDGGEGSIREAAGVAQASLSQRPLASGCAGGHIAANGYGDHGAGVGADERYDDVEDYGDGGEEYEYEEDDGHEVLGAAARATASGVPASAAASGARYANGDGGAGSSTGAAAAPPRSYPPLPLRPDLLQQYIRVVFNASGSPQDQLMAVVALALVEAGRQGAPNRASRSAAAAPPPSSSGASSGADAHRFCLQLTRLVAHVTETAPHLLAGSGGAGGGVHAGALMQRLRERHSRGCIRVLVPGAGAGAGTGPGAVGARGGGDESQEAVAVLDLEVFRERVVEALTAAAEKVFSGSRAVDEIRRAAAVHLASRTRLFAGRAHCVRLTTLAQALSGVLPPEVFDPTRLSGLERIVGAESSNHVMHVFMRQLMPGGLAGLARGHSEEMGTFVTLNLGKLLTAASVRELGSLGAAGRQRDRGRSVPEAAASTATPAAVTAAAAAAAAARAAARAAAFSSTAARPLGHDSHPPHPPPGGGGGNLPPPSDAALRQAVGALFPLPDGGRGGEYGAVAAAARRTAALSLVKALHSQQGGLLPLGRLTEIVLSAVPGAPDVEQLLAGDPDLFEFQEAWSGGPRSVRLRASGVVARAAGSGASASAGPDAFPRRPNAPNCPYYMRHGTCGYGASCKYNHPLLAPRQPPAEPAAASVAATAAQRTPASPAAATHNPQPLPSLPPAPAAPAAAPPAHAAAPPAAAANGSSAAPRPSPVTLEVKLITTACTPDHLDMLQHCYAAPQVAVACKVRHATYSTHLPSSSGVEVGQVCLVQLFAPEVAATGAEDGGGGAVANATHGSGSNSAVPVAGPAPGGGSGGASTAAPRWPATVYLVDPAAGKDQTGMLLTSLSPVLADQAVPKVIYCSSEVVPYMPRISPLHDISVLYSLLVRGPSAVLGPAAGPADAAAAGLVPPLATLLQQHSFLTAAGGAASTAAQSHSPLWAVRPLAPELRQQAVLEVVHLAALWTSLMARLATLPQQLSQAAADRLLIERSAHLAAGGTAPAPSAAACPAGRVAPTAIAGPGGLTMVAVPAVQVASTGPHRGIVSLHRVGW